MNLSKFYFSEFDVNFSASKNNGIYLINSNSDFLNHYLSLQIAFENVMNKNRVIFFTANDFCTLNDYAININIDYKKLDQNENFLPLQYPKNMYSFFKDPGIVTSFLRNIDNYIEEFDPKIVIFDQINKFYLESDAKIESFKSRFLTSIKKYRTINYLFSSVGENFEYKKNENLIEGGFNIFYSYLNKEKNYIIFSNSNKKETKLKIDLSPNGVIIDPKTINYKKVSLKRISIIFYPKILINFEKDIHDLFGDRVLCKSFCTAKELDYHKYSDSYLAIILPDWIGEPSVFELAKKIINKNPKVTLYLLITKLTSYHHKARAKRIGFTAFLEMPGGIEQLRALFRSRMNKSMSNINEDSDSYNIIFDKENIFDNDNYYVEELSKALTEFSKKKIFKEESFVILSIKSKVKFDEKEIEKNINFDGMEIILGKSTNFGFHYILILNSDTSEVINRYKRTILKKFNENIEIEENFTNFENNVIMDYIPQKNNKKIISFDSYFYPFENPNFKTVIKNIFDDKS